MYLITVARAAEDGAIGPVPVTLIAGALHVSVAAANEMIRKLAGRGLVEYRPYRGVELTDAGSGIADRVLRTRRLWATFLADHLEFTPAEADALACHLEHVTPPDAAERLAAWLGDPEVGPLGHPIPPASQRAGRPAWSPLWDADPGVVLDVAAVGGDPATIAFLAAAGVMAGRQIRVVARGDLGLLAETGRGRIHLDRETGERIGVGRPADGR